MPAENEPVCLVASADLMSWSRMQGVVRAAGLKPVQIVSPAKMADHAGPDVRVVLIDLSDAATGLAAVVPAAARLPRVPIVAVGPHVDQDLFAAARAAGADTVLPHSAIGPPLAAALSKFLP